jgi:anti-sigma B factor antagonist
VHRVRVDRDSRATIVSARGELDAYAAPDLTAAFDDAAEDRRLVVDLGGVSFMDSTALGLVVRGVREHGERGGIARVVLPRGTARRIFEITTLEQVLPVSPSWPAALAELAQEP